MDYFLSIALSAVVLGAVSVHAYEQAYPMTAPDQIEVKELPAARGLVTRNEGDYFDNNNGLFMRLFKYIGSNEVAMTTPVEAELKPAAMRFYVGTAQQDKVLTDQTAVTVVPMPKRLVAAIGGQGSYSKENIDAARTKLLAWLKAHPKYQSTGEPYAVFWNSPFTLWFLKRYEVHIPVTKLPRP